MRYRYNTPAWITAIILSHLTSPLAIIWFLITRRDLIIQFGTFTYRVTARHEAQHVERGGSVSNRVRWGSLVIRPDPTARPRRIFFEARGGKVRLYARTHLKLFPRGPDNLPGHGAGGISHSVGPIDIDVERCDPKRPSFRGPQRLAELVKVARMPVFGPAGSPLGLECTNIGSSGHDAEDVSNISLMFANHPRTHEDPLRTEEYLDQVRRSVRDERDQWPDEMVQQFNKQLSKMGVKSTYDQVFRGPERVQQLNGLPPVPTVTLELVASVASPDDGTSTLTPEELRRVRVDRWQFISELIPFVGSLFTALPQAVREQIPEDTCQILCQQVYSTLHTYAPDLVDQIAVSEAQVAKRRLTIGGVEFDGVLLTWPLASTKSLCAFQFTQAGMRPKSDSAPNPGPGSNRLSGTAYGIAYEQVVHLLEQLVIVNERPELITQYQAGMDKHREQLRSYYSSLRAQAQQ